jgi:predicted RNase H-like HicB family nuclease
MSDDKTYNFIFTSDGTGGYVVTCPELPGLVTEGDTLPEALEMAADATRGYLESVAEDEPKVMTVDDLKVERDKLAAGIGKAVTAFQEKTGVYVSGIAAQTITTTSGGGIGSKPVTYSETRVGIGISLEQP